VSAASETRAESPAASWGTPRSRVVSWYEPAAVTAAGAALSGRELLRAIVEGRLPPPPIASLFGAELVAISDGGSVFRCTPDASTYNPVGMVHGGFLCTMLDSAAGCAVQTLLPAGASYASIEIKVSFLRPLRAGAGELVVSGQALRVGGRVAFAEAHARDSEGELVGHATSSLAVFRPPRAS
jgi:uncharacterized protein (TIGR00369 family)